jgi:hypothetical protein
LDREGPVLAIDQAQLIVQSRVEVPVPTNIAAIAATIAISTRLKAFIISLSRLTTRLR